MGDLEDYEDVNPGSADYMDYSNKKGNKDQYGCEKFRKGQGNKERIEKRKCRSLKKCKSMQEMTPEQKCRKCDGAGYLSMYKYCNLCKECRPKSIHPKPPNQNVPYQKDTKGFASMANVS